jgi:hypothetical protein
VFENLEARPARVTQLYASAIFALARGSSLTLRNVSVFAGGEMAVEVARQQIPTPEERQGEIQILDSAIQGLVNSGHGTMIVERSIISNAGLSVFTNGAVDVFPTATADILDSTVTGIFNEAGLVRVRNSTVKPIPSSPPDRPFAYFPIRAVTCLGSPTYIPGGDLIVSNSIFDGCRDTPGEYDPEEVRMHLPDECKGLVDEYPPPTFTSEGGNVVVGGYFCSTADPTDQQNVSPEALGLGPLQDNGGPTETHALLETSVARDAGVDCGSSELDQRGVARPDGDPMGAGVCDSGAVEFVDCDGSGVDDGTEIAQGLLADRDGNLVPNVCQAVPVAIDVRPRDDRNRIPATRRGLVPVALLGSEELDVAEVDVSTLAFGPEGAAPVRAPRLWHRDVDRDGFVDLVGLFRLSQSGLNVDSTEACLSGALFDGSPFEACDAIQIVRRHHGKGHDHGSAHAHAERNR